MKTMLFVDDRWKRIQYALEEFGKTYEIVIAPNFHEAMRALSSRDFDVVELDHDLMGCDFEDPDSCNSGMEIVRYLEKTGWPPSKRKPIFYVHSSNLFAAHLMTVRLQALNLPCFYRPIVYRVEHMVYDELGLPK